MAPIKAMNPPILPMRITCQTRSGTFVVSWV
jgi:hypothetical protein